MTSSASSKYIPSTSSSNNIKYKNTLGSLNILYNKVMLHLMMCVLALFMVGRINAERVGVSTAENANADYIYNGIVIRSQYSGVLNQMVNYLFSQYLPIDYFKEMVLPMISLYKETNGVHSPLEIL